MTKKIDPNDVMRLAGAAGGGLIGLGIADVISGLEDSLTDLALTLTAPAIPLVEKALDVAAPVTDVFGLTHSSIPSVTGKFKITAENHWKAVKQRKFKPLMMMWFNGKISDDVYERMKMSVMQDAYSEYSRWYWNFEDEIRSLVKRIAPDANVNIPEGAFKPSEVTLHPRPADAYKKPENSNSPPGGMVTSPYMQWIADHPLQVGCFLAGAVLGEQVAENKEVAAKVFEALGQFGPKQFEVGI